MAITFPWDERLSRSRTLTLTFTAIFTALVFVATSIFSLYIPQTKGFFNIGESGVYLAALIGGPYVGAFAGGVGSMLADLALGFEIFAPATLMIKGAEGLLVGLLARRQPTKGSPWLALTLLAGFVLFLLGNNYYVGSAEVTFRLPYSDLSIAVELGSTTWMVVLFVFTVFVLFLIMRNPVETWPIFSMALGGLVMVAGYFLYEQFVLTVVLGPTIVALAEVPFNVAQVLVGTTLSLYVFKMFSRLV